MTEVNGQTVIQMTLTQLLLGVGVLASAAYGVAHFTFSGMKGDVADIRKALTETQGRNAETLQTATTADGELRSQLSDLTAELKITNSRLGDLNSQVGNLDTSIRAVDQRLAENVNRQTEFEKWVTLRLGPAGTAPTSYTLPIEWQKVQGEILDQLKQGDDPMLMWFKASAPR